MFGIAQKLIGSVNDRKIRPFRSIDQRINALEPVTEALSDEALKQRTRGATRVVPPAVALGRLSEQLGPQVWGRVDQQVAAGQAQHQAAAQAVVVRVTASAGGAAAANHRHADRGARAQKDQLSTDVGSDDSFAQDWHRRGE